MTLPTLTLPHCDTPAPFVTLANSSHAPALDYNLPFSTVYSATSFVGLPIDQGLWINAIPTPPVRDRWAEIDDTITEYASHITAPTGTPPWTARQLGAHDALAIEAHLVVNADAMQPAGNVVLSAGQSESQASYRTAQQQTVNQIATSPISEPFHGERDTFAPLPAATLQNRSSSNRNYLARWLGNMEGTVSPVAKPYLPMQIERFSGRPEYVMMAKPPEPDRHISLVFHYKFASFLGQYGAGKVLNTFSLLPGETTAISIKHYARTEEARKKAESVLDSFSQSSADDLQDSIDNETQFATSLTKADTLKKTGSWHAGGSAGLNLGFFSIGASGGGGGSTDSSSSITDAMSTAVKALSNSVSHHASKADASRNIDVNTETTSTAVTEDEETITRQLQNLNKSRVLNFVFRQLLQEYVTVTWLDDISVVYYDGFPDNKQTAKLGQLDQLLHKVLNNTGVTAVRGMITDIITNGIYDYQDQMRSFVTTAPGKTYDSMGLPHPITRLRKKHAGVTPNDWGPEATYNSITVDGIIVDVQSRMMRTPSVIVDSVLGQGNALDCYNTNLQNAAVDSAVIENARRLQALSILDSIGDPTQKATLYKKVFGDCCDVAQSGCGCGETGGTGGQGGVV